MHPSDYPDPSPAVEKLRDHIRAIYSPIDRSGESVDLTLSEVCIPENPMHLEEVLFTARSLSTELSVPLSQVLRVVHKGLIRPMARSTAGGMLFSKSQLTEIRNLIKSKP